MIPHIIHYCWFGGNEIPDVLKGYMSSWQKFMPDWEIRRWDESNFSISSAPLYVQEAYEYRKFAFVSDYVRLWVLEQYGGVYFDTDVQVLRSFDPLMDNTAFIGLEASLAHLPGTCVMGCVAHCRWVKEMLGLYDSIHFVLPDGSLDLTTNVERMGRQLKLMGFVAMEKEQYVEPYGLQVYTHDYFSPITSTRVMRKSKNTYSIHHFAGSWTNSKHYRFRDSWLVREAINALIQVKRKIKGVK